MTKFLWRCDGDGLFSKRCDTNVFWTCPIYSDITEKYPNVDDDDNLVKYLHEVLTRRDLIDDLENHEDD